METTDWYIGAQEPKRILWKDRWWAIDEVVDQWYEGYVDETMVPMKYFRVKTAEGVCFILRYHQLFDKWSIIVR